MESGSVTFRKTFALFEPKSKAASSKLLSIFIRVEYNGITINGKKSYIKPIKFAKFPRGIPIKAKSSFIAIARRTKFIQVGVISKSKTEFKRFVYFMLPDNRELANEFCSMLEQWNSMDGAEKSQKISRLNLRLPGKVPKHIIADRSPAMDIISIALRILVHYGAKLTATRVTRGTQDYYYDRLVKLIVDTFHMGKDSPVLMQHWPETYLAWMLSGTEHELFTATSYTRVKLK